MASARFIGRVGGLAIALGIGVAVAQGAPTASADASPSHSSPGQAQKKQPGPQKSSGLKARTAPAKVVSVAPAVARPGKRIPGVAGRDPDGTPAAAAVWALAAAARRELNHDDSEVKATASGGQAAAATTTYTRTDTTVIDAGHALATTVTDDSVTGVNTVAAVIDTTTGTQIGNPVSLPGSPSSVVVLTTGGSRTLITTTQYESSSGTATTWAAVIDTASGTQTGATLTVSGDQVAPALDTDGRHVVLIARDYSQATPATQVVVFDTLTGTQTGNTITIAGSLPKAQLMSAGGNHVMLITVDGPVAGVNTVNQVAVIDATAGTQVGATVSIPGFMIDAPVVSGDGVHVMLTADVIDEAGVATTYVAVIDTSTGTQTGTTLSIPGYRSGTSLLTTDHRYALLITLVSDPAAGSASTRISAVDTANGAQLGSTIFITGRLSGAQLLFDGNTHALITTSTGFAVFVDASTGTSPLTLLGPPFGFDYEAFLSIPAVSTAIKILAGVSVWAVFIFGTLGIGIYVNVYNFFAGVLGLPAYGEWELAQPETSTAQL
jgi:hypothetical protein